MVSSQKRSSKNSRPCHRAGWRGLLTTFIVCTSIVGWSGKPSCGGPLVALPAKKLTTCPALSRKAANRLMNAIGSVLVDTSIVVDYFRQDLTLHEKIDQVEEVYVPLVILGELFYGAHKSTQ